MGRGVKSSAQRQRAVQFAVEAMEQRCLLSGATIGMNLDGISDDSTIGAFNDLAKMFRPWGQVGTPYQPDASIPVTAQDYPLADAGAITYATTYPDGIYQVSYDGVGDVSFRGLGHAIFDITSHVNDHWTGTLDLAHDENGGGILELYIKNVDQADPIHNLHIISPDANPAISPTFRPVFLDKLKDWNGTLRFMDWQQTNSNPQVNWSDRTQLDRFSYVTAGGVPLETIIELANLTRKDIWINTPFNANDDFIKNMADLFRDGLNPSLKVFVENSNELWNFQFQQTIDLLHATQADNDPLFTGTDDFGRMAQEAAKRMVNVTNLFRQEFGAARFDAQVRPVFGSFIAVPYWAQQGMDYIARKFGSPRDYIYGLAVAPYVGNEGDIASIDDDSLTMQKLFDSMNSFIDTNISLWLEQHKAVCDQYGLKLESYEAGQSLQAQNGMNEALKVAAQDDPLMGQMYQHLINVWLANGGDIFNNFSLSNHYSINGYWGLLDRIDEVTSTKWEAVHSMLPQGGPLPAAQVSVSSGLVGKRGDVVHAYISIDDAAGLSSIDLALNYNTSELDLSNADVTLTGVLGSDWTLVPNVNDATGKLTLTAYTSGVQPTGGGHMIDIAFHVRSDAAAAALVLDLDDGGSPARSRLNEGQMAANFIDGSLTVPVAAAITGAPSTDPEGTAISLGSSLSGQNGAVTYLWHVSASNGQAIADSTNPNFTFTPVDDGTYVVSLSVLDANGIAGGDSKNILVTNVAPAAAITGAPATSAEGTAISLASSVTDPGTDTFTYVWSVTKDGAAYGGGTGTAFTFTPDDNGNYVVSLSVTDDDGGVGTASKTINVTNVAPTAAIAGAPVNSPEGTPVHLTSTVSDAGSADTFTYVWTVTKNGQTYRSGTSANFTFTPDLSGSYVIQLVVKDDDGGIGTDTKTVAVTTVAPTTTINGAPASSPEGTLMHLDSAVTFAGAVQAVTYSWTILKNGASYAAGTGDSIDFTPDDDGIYAVNLTMTDAEGAVGTDNATITVTNVAPSASIVGVPATSPEGTGIVLTSTVTDAGSADTFSYAWTVTKNGNAYATGSAAGFNFTPDDDGSYVITLRVTDDDGGMGTDSKTMTVTNVNPTAAISGAPASSPEGTAIHLTGAGADAGAGDTLTTAWTVLKNGNAYASGVGTSLDFTPDDNGSYVVTFKVTDDDGGVGTDVKTIAVTNVNPVAAIAGAPASSPEGTAIALSSIVNDAGSADTQTYAWSVTKNGNAYASGTSAGFTFTPDDNGAYVVTLTVTDDDGGVGSDVKTISVTNVNPTAAIIGAAASSAEGTTIALFSSVSDAGSADTQTYAWSVTKNGTAYASGSSAAFSFTPDDNGSYVVTLTATDDDGGIGSDTKTIAITNVAPTAAIHGAPATSAEGTAIALTSTVSDAGAADTQTYAWKVLKNGASFATGTNSGFSFTPDDNGSYVVTLTVTDDDGGMGSDTTTIAVTNVAPVASIVGAPVTSPEGTAINLTSTVTDAGTADTQTYAWTVTKNGNPYASGTSAAFSFTPDDNGSYIVSLTVTDDDGGIGTDSKTIAVTNVNPTAAISGAPSTSPEGSAISLSGTTTDAGSADTQTFTWAVTKNGNAYTSGTGTAFTFTPDDNGTFVVTLTVTDDDGGVGTDSRTIAVTNVAPVALIHGAPATSPEGTAIHLTGSASDAGSADTVAFDWTVTRGGNAFASGSGAAFTFTPDSPGDYLVTLRAVDDDGGANSVSTTITATFVTFRVASATPTDSGFDFSFNRAVNFGALNLYASADGVHGAADVTVTGAIAGTVHGSLVYDAGRGIYSFVKTGGVLLPDTYTVTLVSKADASDGWTDLRGGALDGNSDGTAGDSYTNTFTIAATPQRVVGLADFSRGPGQVVNVPNAAIGLPVSINDSTDLSSVVMTITFDPSLLNITGASGPAGWTTSLSQDSAGQVTITASGTALANGIANLFHLTATVPAGASYGATDLIRITQLTLNGGAIAGRGDAAIHEVAYFGDVTGNHQYSGMDAMYIARVAAELDDGFAAYDRIDPRIIGDITGDGSLSGLDSHYVARKAVGLDVAQIPEIPAAPAPALASAALPVGAPIVTFDLPAGVTLSLPAGLVAKPGATIHVPVNVSDYGDIRSLDLTILYDTSLLDLSNPDVTLGQAGAGWTLVQNANDSTGKLRLTLYRAVAIDGGPGEMIDLAFHIPLAVPSSAPAVTLAGDVDEGAVPLTGGAGTLLIDAVAPKVASAVFDPNGGAHQLTVKFSENVGASLSLNDLTVTNTTSGQTIGGGAMVMMYDPATFTAIITFPGLPGGILPDGDYRLTIAAAGVTDLAGNSLDGQSSGTAGVDYSLAFYQLLGDLNRDHVVDQADRTILNGAMTGGTIILAKDGDTNGDHQVNFADLVAVAQHYGQNTSSTAAGDVNGDGVVSFADLVAVAQHYGRDGRGDLNGDGLINQADLNLLDTILNPAPMGAALPISGEAVGESFDTAAVMTAPVAAPTPVATAAPSAALMAVEAPQATRVSTASTAPLFAATPMLKAAPISKQAKASANKATAGKRPIAFAPEIQTPSRVVAPRFNPSKRIKRSWLETAD